MPQFYDHSVQSSAEGSAEISLKDANNNVQFVVVNGISMTGESGTSFIANWSLLTLVQGFLAAGRYTPSSHHVEQLPRVSITSPNATTNLRNPTSVTVGWSREWLRWDGRTYTDTYPSGYSEASPLSYAVMYSDDNGATWRYMQDNSAATPGVRPSNPGNLISSASATPSYTWATPERHVPSRDVSDPRGGVPRHAAAPLRVPPVPRVHPEGLMANERVGQRGLSLIEAMITLVLLTIGMAVFYELMISASRAGMFTESRNDLAVISERVVNTIQTEVTQSRLIFEDNAVGAGYRTLFVERPPAGDDRLDEQPDADHRRQQQHLRPGPRAQRDRESHGEQPPRRATVGTGVGAVRSRRERGHGRRELPRGSVPVSVLLSENRANAELRRDSATTWTSFRPRARSWPTTCSSTA